MSTNVKMYNNPNVTQQINLAPQLLNWLKLLQASSLELSDLVTNELASNPALEMAEPEDKAPEDDYALNDTANEETHFDDTDVGERLSVLADIDDEWQSADSSDSVSGNATQEKYDYMMDNIASSTGLQSMVEQALQFADLSEMDEKIAWVIAGSINERGYLESKLEEIALQSGCGMPSTISALEKFQQIVPAGIGARDLRECLLIQLKALEEDTGLAEEIVQNWLDNIAMGHQEVLAERLDVENEDISDAMETIRTLDPEPGLRYQNMAVEYVEADLNIYERNGELQVELLDSHIPHLQLSSYCKRLLEARNGSKEDLDYIRKKVREATFLIQGISQRQETMLKVAREIMRVQREYLTSKEGQLQPLTMNKVASMIGVHETTVSRAIANKYIRTERGLVEMRKFFKAGYRCSDGSSVTPERVKGQVSDIIGEEEEMAPLTDAQISGLFQKQGLKVARRTIAKYREEMGIPSSKARLAAAKKRSASKLPVAV